MCKTDIYKILEYENFKYNFFINKKQNDFISEEFSSYEEKIYGRELCKIYEDLYKINYGKRYIKEMILVFMLYVIHIIFININIYQNSIAPSPIDIALNIIVGIFLFIKVLAFKKYYSFLLYTVFKLRKNKSFRGKYVL